MVVFSTYLRDAFEYKNTIIREALDVLSKVDFDSIVVRGHSGMLIAPIIAHLLNKPIAFVRKKNESTHSSMSIEGIVLDKYIIIDDFIDTGATIKEIDITTRRVHSKAQLVGVYLYLQRWPIKMINTSAYSDRMVPVVSRVWEKKAYVNWQNFGDAENDE